MKNKKKKNDELEKYSDITVANMNVEGMPWYKDEAEKKRTSEMHALNISKEERRAMIKGAYRAMLPAFLIGLLVICVSFGLVMLYFWLVTK